MILTDIVANLSNDMYLPAFPQMATQFSTSNFWIQITLAAWLIGCAAAQLLVGVFTDRFGGKDVFIVGSCLFIFSSLLISITSNIELLILGRFLQGAAVCAIIIPGYSVVHTHYKDRQAIYIFAWITSAAALCPMIGPLLGSYVLNFGTWQLIFKLLALGLIIMASILYFIMPTVEIKKVTYKAKKLKLIITYKNIISNRRFLLGSIIYGLLYGVIIAWISTSPFLIIQHLGYSPTSFAYIQLCIFSSYIIGSQLANWLLRKIDLEQIITIGMLLILTSTFFMIISNIYSPGNLICILLSMIGIIFSCGLIVAPLNRVTVKASKESIGATVAVFYFIMLLFGAFGSAMASIIYNGTILSVSITISSFIVLSFIAYRWRSSDVILSKSDISL